MTCYTSVLTPEPLARFVIMVFLPEMPVRAHTTPFTLLITPEGAQAVPVHANALVLAPNPTFNTMELVVEMITSVQFPETANDDPFGTGPAVLDSQTI